MAGGASIQVVECDAFQQMIELTDGEVLQLIKAGKSQLDGTIAGRTFYHSRAPKYQFAGEKFDGVSLETVDLYEIAFANDTMKCA